MSSELDKLYAQRMIPKSEIKIKNADIDDSVIFDINNRTINSGGVQDVLVEKDNICRTIKFRIQKHFEEIDLSTKSVSIRYTTPLGESDEAFGVNRNTETDYITFDWIISNKATSTSGELQFDVIFYSEDGYSWHTKSSILMVEKGLKVTTITPKPSQDWIDSWRSEAGQYLLNYQNFEDSVNNAIDILETSLPAITTAVEQCEIAVASVEQLKQETEMNANLAFQNAISASLEVERAAEQVDLSKTEAERAKVEADRSKTEADRAQTASESVHDVYEFPLKSDLPVVGYSEKIYTIYEDTKENNGLYRWNGESYDPISAAVDYASVEETLAGQDATKVVTPATVSAAIKDNSVIKEINADVKKQFWVGTKVEMDAIGEDNLSSDTVYMTTDEADVDIAPVFEKLDELEEKKADKTFVTEQIDNVNWADIKGEVAVLSENHNHDGRYYSEEEVTALFNTLLTELQNGTTVVGKAVKLTTPRKINTVAFDGTSDITITAAANGGNANTVNGFSFDNRGVDGTPAYVPGFTGGSPIPMPMYKPALWRVGSASYADSAGNSDTVDGSHAWHMQTLNSSGQTHGPNSWALKCQHNIKGDSRFFFVAGDGSVQTSVDYAHAAASATNASYAGTAGNSDAVDGFHIAGIGTSAPGSLANNAFFFVYE